MSSYVIVLLFVTSISAIEVNNINKQTDEALVKLNKAVTNNGDGLIVLTDRSNEIWKRPATYHATLLGLNSLNRTGDCTLTVFSNGTKFLDFHIGLRLFVLSNALIQYKHDSMSGAVRINNNSFRISFAVHKDEKSCNVTVTKYRMEYADSVIFSSSLVMYDNKDVSVIFRRHVVPYINEKMADMEPMFQSFIENSICHKDANLKKDGLQHIVFLPSLIRRVTPFDVSLWNFT